MDQCSCPSSCSLPGSTTKGDKRPLGTKVGTVCQRHLCTRVPRPAGLLETLGGSKLDSFPTVPAGEFLDKIQRLLNPRQSLVNCVLTRLHTLAFGLDCANCYYLVTPGTARLLLISLTKRCSHMPGQFTSDASQLALDVVPDHPSADKQYSRCYQVQFKQFNHEHLLGLRHRQ